MENIYISNFCFLAHPVSSGNIYFYFETLMLHKLFERFEYRIDPIAIFHSSYVSSPLLKQAYDVTSKTCTIFIHAHWVVDGRRDAVEST